MHKLYRSVLLTGMVAVGLAGCGDDVTVVDPPAPPPPPAPTVKSISVTPDGTTLTVGQTRTFSAAVVADEGVATTVTWSSSDNAVATINATSGVATGVAPGSVGIKATSTVNPAVQGNATLTVVAAPTSTVTGVTVTPGTISLNVGQTAQLAATVLGTNNPSQAVTWSSLDNTVATVNPATGLVTAVANGTAVIRATSTANANFSGTASVTVSTPAPATVSLQSLTVGATNVPVNLNNVAGQIEATINLDPGAQAVSRVEIEFTNLLGDGSAFNQQILAAQTLTVAAPSTDEGVSAAPQIVVLSFNTNQVRMGANTFVPVTYNGNTRVRAVLVLASGTRLGSNEFVIVMNNPDAALAPAGLDVAAGSASFVNAGVTWWKSGLTTNITYLSYSRYVPTAAGVTLDAGCGTVTNSQNGGTHLTGIIITRNWSCASTEGVRNVTGLTAATYPAGSIGFDGSVIAPAASFSTRGGVFQVAGQDRWNVINPLPAGYVLPTRAVDNLGPSIAVSTVAFNALYDQQWVNASYAFAGNFTPTDGGSGVAAGTLTVYEFVGAACTSSPAIVTGNDFPETLTSDLADSKRVCARASDNLGNAGVSGASNNFGVDKLYVAGNIRLYFATGIDQVGINITPGVSATANTTRYQIAGALADQPWGLEAQDTRSGFNQFVIAGDDAAHQSLTRLWPGVPGQAGATSACTLSDQLVTTLSDFWKRTMLPFTTLDCGAGVGYYWYTGNVNDRAGNFSPTIARNFVFDPGTPNITGLGFDPAGYTGGSAATFSVAANDDLSVMTGTLTFLIPGMKNPWVGIQYPHGSLNSLGTPWATMRSQLTDILNGGALTVPNLLTRVDESCEFNADPYPSCDVTTNGPGSKPTVAADYNANLFAGGSLTNTTKVPTGVITNVADIVGREAVSALVTPILLTQYNGHAGGSFNAQPWSTADIANWTVTRTVSVVTAVHRTISSNGLTYFDDASLWRLNTATNVWVFCGMMTTPTLPTIDNGTFRTWSYTAAVPAAGTACGVLTGNFKVMGRKSYAGLFTVSIP